MEEIQGGFYCVKGFLVSSSMSLRADALVSRKQAAEISEHKSEHLLQV